MQALERAIEICRTQAKLAAAMGIVKGKPVRQSHISTWLKTGVVPAAYCPSIERATDGRVRVEELAPGVEWEVVRRSNGVSYSASRRR